MSDRFALQWKRPDATPLFVRSRIPKSLFDLLFGLCRVTELGTWEEAERAHRKSREECSVGHGMREQEGGGQQKGETATTTTANENKTRGKKETTQRQKEKSPLHDDFSSAKQRVCNPQRA